MIRRIATGDADYPRSLHELKAADRPHAFTVEGDFSRGAPRVAIVGAREAVDDTLAIAKRIASAIAANGGIVISGGALGVDAAAHEGALEAGGRTWSVIGCGGAHVTPQENKELFASILARGGAIIRTRDDATNPRNQHLYRNRVLVALSEAVVVVQAGRKSGTMSSATWALALGRPMWVVPSARNTAHEKSFEGTWILLEGRHATVRALWSEKKFIEHLFGRVPSKPPKGLTEDELRVFETLALGPKHPDEIADETGLPTPAVTTALLTLALGDVVVEGSAGLFQRKAPS